MSDRLFSKMTMLELHMGPNSQVICQFRLELGSIGAMMKELNVLEKSFILQMTPNKMETPYQIYDAVINCDILANKTG